MQQVVQSIRSGKLNAMQVPEPLVRPGCILIQNRCSVISAGTEKMVVDLASKSLLQKARQRPDLIRQIVRKIRTQGLWQTFQQVSSKLDEPIALGYASTGVVLACGAGVQGFRPGDRVASNGNHAGVVCVPKHLCALVPENVTDEEAAFTVIGSIALQGVRLARLGLGDTVLVVGLGLIGQIAVKLLKAQGCCVLATDLDAAKCEIATRSGADYAVPNISAEQVRQMTRGYGADAVLLTAATSSNGPVELAGDAVRAKGRVVVVGVVGMTLPRQPYYLKEVEFIISCSYGPGRYDVDYEQRGHDYPIGYVRWTEQRNMQAILDLFSERKLDIKPLITHRFTVEEAEQAYDIIKSGSQPYLGILLKYPQREIQPHRCIEVHAKPACGDLTIGCVGAGNFGRGVLLPAIRRIDHIQLRTLASAGGLSAATTATNLGFCHVATDEQEIFRDRAINTVFILTRHNQHATQVISSLRSGKHTFVEKPLATTVEDLYKIETTLMELGEKSPLLMVGFNRRFSPAALAVKQFFASVRTPLTVSVRFNAGYLPPDHWAQDEVVGGGRIIGEACHAIDLATYLVGSPAVRVFADSVGGANAPLICDDQCFITLRHANGSISNVAYLSGGDKEFPKERIEVFGGGRLAIIDDFREVVLSVGGKQTRKGWTQDKGHTAEIAAFAQAIRTGGEWPIPWTELRATTLASILAIRSLREGMPLELQGVDCESEEPENHARAA
jgi:predicted dehydrogenase/threonine dehydrogenase-like Zn-dependent dehydrogenase